jgi:hypothetical protein
MKKRRKLSAAGAKLRAYWERLKAEEPEKWKAKVERARERANWRIGKKAESTSEASGGEGDLLAYVVEIPVNPRMVFARSSVSERFEVVVGNNRVLWVDCPLWVRASSDYPGYYEVVGELPKGRWDRFYALRFS